MKGLSTERTFGISNRESPHSRVHIDVLSSASDTATVMSSRELFVAA